jgi:hypothetical protein
VTLGEKQRAFVGALGELLRFVYLHNSWAFSLSEGYVGDTDARDGDRDSPHLKGGCHDFRLAIDLNLFINGIWITDGGHPAWKQIGEFWETLHPLARWGGRFNDANHFSFTHNGRS